MKQGIINLNHTTRRNFLKTQAVGVVSAAMCSTFNPFPSVSSYAQSPNDRFKIGFIGCGGMGTGDASDLAHFGDIVALADVRQERLDYFKSNSNIVSKPDEVYVTQDYRKVLERRRNCRHFNARSLACKNCNRGVTSRQARILPEASNANNRGEQADPQGR